jgi:hypothetical protein
VPSAAARQAELVTGDLHPLELGRGGQHRLDQLMSLALHHRALGQGPAGLGHPVGQLVAQALDLTEVEEPRLGRDRADPVSDLDAPEPLGHQTGQLTLQAPDLPPQLESREALVDCGAERREAVSFEQVGHRPRPECRSRSTAGKAGSG